MRIRDKIFISYSHEDERLLAEFKATLAPLLKDKGDVWDDTTISPGQKWEDEIQKALESARVGVLFVSESFLRSVFVKQVELPALLDAAETDGATIFWVCLSDLSGVPPAIACYQAANDPRFPLAKMANAQRMTAWTEISNKLLRICRPEPMRHFWATALEGHDPKDRVCVVFSAKRGKEWVDGESTREPGHTPLLSYNEVDGIQGLQESLASFSVELRFRLVHGGVDMGQGVICPPFSQDRTLIVVGSPNANRLCRELLSNTTGFPYQFGAREEKTAGTTRRHKFIAVQGHPNYESKEGASGVEKDFGIIARIRNPFGPPMCSGPPHYRVLILAGCHGFGTESAIQFVRSPGSVTWLQDQIGQDENDFALLFEAFVGQQRGLSPRPIVLSTLENGVWRTRCL